MYNYPERPYNETNLCEMRLVWLLSDLGVPRRVSLLLSQQQATAMLGATVRDRVIDGMIARMVPRA